VLRGEAEGPWQKVYRTEAREFQLALLSLTAEGPFEPEPGRGVEILLGLEGTCVLRAGGEERPLGRGQAVFVPASTRSYTVEGSGRVARASVPS
jgi:mannose-6-phosphate isomerase class I